MTAAETADRRSPGLALRLLGTLEVERAGRDITATLPAKGRALLGYLAAEPGVAHPRRQLAELFWPELGEAAARNNLRQVLLQLQRALGDKTATVPWLEADREQLRFNPDRAPLTDLAALAAPLPGYPSDGAVDQLAASLERIERLANRYRGEFMAGIEQLGGLARCLEFDEWLRIRREALLRRQLLLLERLADGHERLGGPSRALAFALRFTELEPWNEEGQRRVMRLAALTGGRGAALGHYHHFRRSLVEELGALPEEETRELARRIRDGAFDPRQPPPPRPTANAPAMPALERRQVTVLYLQFSADGEGELEEALERLADPHRQGVARIEAAGGHVVRTHDGGLLAYFGYPRALENAARLAVRTALTVVGTPSPGVTTRAGVHTGVILAGADPALPDTVGHASAVAIELRRHAGDGEVLISATTQRLVEGYFDCRAADRAPAGPTGAYRVVGESGADHRIAAAHRLTPLIARRHEREALATAWRAALAGEGTALLLRGDPGIGKSRLVHQLKRRVERERRAVLELRCAPEAGGSPLQPVAELFSQRTGFAPGDTPEARFAKLAGYLERDDPARAAEQVPLFAAMLGLPVAPPYRECALATERRRGRILALLLERLRRRLDEGPLLVVVEDLHWIDPSTLELLTRAVNTGGLEGLLLLFTARPEFIPPWPPERVERIELAPLSREQTAALIRATDWPVSDAAVEGIVRRADGVPLFAEELARVAAEEPEGGAIPATLKDLLAARLDALGEAKQVAQLAAALGERSPPAMIEALIEAPPRTLASAIRRLRRDGLVTERAAEGIRFRHALFRDAAYQSLGRADRRAIHRRIAEALESRFPEEAEWHPENIAHHWWQAGEPRAAVEYWIRAGRLAHLHGAHHEAVKHFNAGLGTLAELTEGGPRRRLELALQVGLGAATYALEGYASPAGWAAYGRAVELSETVAAGADTFQALWGLWASTSSHSDWGESLKRARRLVALAERGGDPVQTQQAHFAVGNIQFWRGQFDEAREQLERAIDLYLPEHHPALVTGYGENAFATSGGYLSWTLCLLGHPRRALEAGRRSVAEARRINHPFSLGYALTFHTVLHRMLRLPEETLGLAEETIALARAHGFPLWEAGAGLKRGWARVVLGEPDGLAEMERCVAAARELMSGITVIFLETLADARLRAGRAEQALEAIEEALSLAARLDDHHVEAELHRLKGLALLDHPAKRRAEAEGCLRRSLTIARNQRALLLELRAAAALARLTPTAATRRGLARVVEAFDDGGALPDLVEARALLAD